MNLYLGIDIGSVTVKLALVDNAGRVVDSVYLRTQGRPVQAVQQGLAQLRARLPAKAAISGVGTTGSARYLAAAIVGGDVVKNEITSQAVAAARAVPGARTIIEIGGQDSKIICPNDGMVADFGMNTVCAAGTGSFLDHQAARLGIAIEELRRPRAAQPEPGPHHRQVHRLRRIGHDPEAADGASPGGHTLRALPGAGAATT